MVSVRSNPRNFPKGAGPDVEECSEPNKTGVRSACDLCNREI